MNRVNIDACVHCGLCLPSCPTYLVTGRESESPRGRVVLLQQLRAAAPGGGPLDAEAVRCVDSCLDCRACEAVCPAHVPVGHAVEEFRAGRRETAHGAVAASAGRYFGSEAGLRRFQRLTRWAGRPVGRRLLRYAQRLPGSVGATARLGTGLPAAIPDRLGRDRARGGGEGPAVLLFYGCVMDSVYPTTMSRTADLLRAAGYRVVLQEGQVCCGALHTHAGDPEQARRWARTNVSAWRASGASLVAVNAAGCGAALKEYSLLLAEDAGPVVESARAFSAAVRDVAELVDPERLPALAPRREAATVHDPCHLAHAQGIRSEVRALLERVGYPVSEMPEADVCCGSAGLYNLTHPDMAAALQRRKVANIPPEAHVVASANPGCLLQIRAGVSASGRSVRVAHWVDLVWQALDEGGIGWPEGVL